MWRQYFFQLHTYFSRPIQAPQLAWFRIGVGLLFFIKAWNQNDKMYAHYGQSEFFFTFRGFEFLGGLPYPFLEFCNLIEQFSALGIMLGFLFVPSCILYFLAASILFFLERSYYENHLYLFLMIAAILPMTKAGSFLSLGSLLKGNKQKDIPLWNLSIFRILIVIVFFYAGVAKINPDWLQGEPIGGMLYYRTIVPPPDSLWHNLFGPIFIPFFDQRWFVLLLAYGGLFFDLLAGFGLWWKKTRIPFFIMAIAFNLFNAFVFGLSIFPWFMILTLVLFLDPKNASSKSKLQTRKLTTGLIVAFLVIQILLPVRHFFIPGDRNWTEEHKDFAWQMKIRAKQARDVVLYQEGPGEKEIVPIFDYMNFTQANAMAQTPFMLWQFANYLDQQSSEDLKITAHISLSLNNRPHQPFIDSSHDITSESYPWFGHADWILPLDKDAPIHDYSVLTEE